MESITDLLHYLNPKVLIDTLLGWMGDYVYLGLFFIVFAETGLAVGFFLPGDSLLFAAGAIASIDSAGLNVWILIILLIVAAILGDMANYHIGKFAAPKVSQFNHRFFNQKHLEKTQHFYQRFGGKAIVMARFIPIVRTFAPFVAGMGMMPYRSFVIYNVIGAICWVISFTLAGFYFGNIPQIKSNFHFVIFAIIFLSTLPAVIEVMREKNKASKSL